MAHDAAAAGQLAGELEAQLARSLASMGEEQTRLGAAVPAQLPEQRSARDKPLKPRVLLAHADGVDGMRPKEAVPDARETVNYIASRQANQRLPTTRTTMRLDDGFERDELEIGDDVVDETYRRVHFNWRP